MILKRQAVTFFIVGLFVLTVGVFAQAETLRVCASGCPYSSIQSAVIAANAYGADTVEVGPGEYVGPIQISRSVNIRGAGAASTIIHGGMIVGGVGLMVRLDNLTISGGLNGLAVVGEAHVIARQVRIANNTSDGVLIADQAQVELFNVDVVDNGIVVAGNPIGSGILATGRSRVITSIVNLNGNANSGVVGLDNSVLMIGSLTNVIGNGVREGTETALVTAGIVVGGQSTAMIDAVMVAGNGATGIAVRAEAFASIRNTTVTGNLGAGIQVGGSYLSEFDVPRVATAIIENTMISDNASYGVLIGDPSQQREIAIVTVNQSGIKENGVCGVGIDVQNAQASLTNNFFENNADTGICQV